MFDVQSLAGALVREHEQAVALDSRVRLHAYAARRLARAGPVVFKSYFCVVRLDDERFFRVIGTGGRFGGRLALRGNCNGKCCQKAKYTKILRHKLHVFIAIQSKRQVTMAGIEM
jgi:hypothetical protein